MYRRARKDVPVFFANTSLGWLQPPMYKGIGHREVLSELLPNRSLTPPLDISIGKERILPLV